MYSWVLGAALIRYSRPLCKSPMHVCQQLTSRLEVPQFCHVCKLNHTMIHLAHVTVGFRRVPFLLSWLGPLGPSCQAIVKLGLSLVVYKNVKSILKIQLYRDEGRMEFEPLFKLWVSLKDFNLHLNDSSKPSTSTVRLRCWKCSSVTSWVISSWNNCIRYGGGSWFVVHVLQLLPIRFTPQNSCCTSKTRMETYAKTGLKIGPSLDLVVWLSEVHNVCWFLIWIHT
jgi:hypothetical protein